MYGVVTRNADEIGWSEFDRGFYEVKDVTGRSEEPVSDGVNMVSCFGDNAAADADPSLVPVDDFGRPATRDRKYFDWAYICPSRTDYREGLLEIIDDCVDANEDVRLDDVGFPRPEYCRCGVCEQAFEASEYDDRMAWRASVITDFVAEAADRIPGTVYLTLYPDPYPGHLYERSGLDLAALEEYVDEFVVPLYDTAYGTTYWLETIAKGFESALETPFSIELYAVNVDVDNLIHATEVASAYGEDVFFGYEAGNARAAIRRLRADEREGETFGEPSDS
ncbi:hypothetical protein [Natrarchaeobaculum aegyptiacum]|uniref:Glycoside hydrolase domain protein n=1 Tax=Natrarchaeobaculum aegyptiacum TaxID=745377 RepID=A0A2Z2HVY9_9EURY|nr:hypothetical protein [Natrarchaeobaculum aegyptiacum]ARS91380.1 hypothetical protein B1756_17745 [Natrarchaeobaculum aegyptiacum]